MKKPTRKQALAWITLHAMHGDLKSATRIYIENRISWAAYQSALLASKENHKTPTTQA